MSTQIPDLNEGLTNVIQITNGQHSTKGQSHNYGA